VRTEGFKNPMLPKLVAISIAVLLLVLTLTFIGSGSSPELLRRVLKEKGLGREIVEFPEAGNGRFFEH